MELKFTKHLEEAVKGPAKHLDTQAKELLHLKRDLASAKKASFTISNDLRSADLHWAGSAKKYHDLAVADSQGVLEPIWNPNLAKELTKAKAAMDAMYEAIDNAETIAEMQIRYANERKKKF